MYCLEITRVAAGCYENLSLKVSSVCSSASFNSVVNLGNSLERALLCRNEL